MHRTFPRCGSWRMASLLLAVLWSLLVSGCISHVKELRDAQEQFNTAAGIENRIRLNSDGEAGDAVVLRGQADAAYRLSAVMLAEVIRENRKELLRDKLLGNAYTVKALAEWRLGEYAAALHTLEESRAEKAAEIYPRDKALQTALEGLIMNDQAVAHMRARDYEYRAVKDLLSGALDSIARGITEATRGDSVRLYLCMSEMGVLKNWTDLRGEPEKYANAVPADFSKSKEIPAWCERAVPVWQAFVDELALIERERSARMREYWGRTLTMPETCTTVVP